MQESLLETQKRIERFRRQGGVDLARLDPEDPLKIKIETGTAELKKAIYQFQCVFCGRIEKLNTDMSPMCTGPSWTNDHPPEVMRRIA